MHMQTGAWEDHDLNCPKILPMETNKDLHKLIFLQTPFHLQTLLKAGPAAKWAVL